MPRGVSRIGEKLDFVLAGVPFSKIRPPGLESKNAHTYMSNDSRWSSYTPAMTAGAELCVFSSRNGIIDCVALNDQHTSFSCNSGYLSLTESNASVEVRSTQYSNH